MLLFRSAAKNGSFVKVVLRDEEVIKMMDYHRSKPKHPTSCTALRSCARSIIYAQPQTHYYFIWSSLHEFRCDTLNWTILSSFHGQLIFIWLMYSVQCIFAEKSSKTPNSIRYSFFFVPFPVMAPTIPGARCIWSYTHKVDVVVTQPSEIRLFRHRFYDGFINFAQLSTSSTSSGTASTSNSSGITSVCVLRHMLWKWERNSV